MTYKEAIAKVGKVGTLKIGRRMSVFVKVLNIRARRAGYIEVCVVPEDGMGDAWVSINRITAWVD